MMGPAQPEDVGSIHIDLVDPDTMELWRTVAKVAQELSGQNIRWCLVGGLMVALFAIEAGQIQRPTRDIDILGDARGRPSGTEAVTERLDSLGGTLQEIGGLDAKKGFRFAVHGQVVDVLAPDGLRRPALTRGPLQALPIPGGTQALQRAEPLEIVVGDERALLYRPTLLGAILLKARSLRVHDRPADQREDLVTLLALMTDPRSARAAMKATEVNWLRAIQEPLDLADSELEATFDSARLRVARAAFELVTA
jgi:hypothetical protein